MKKKTKKKRTKSFKKRTIKFKVSHKDLKILSQFNDKSIQESIKNKTININKGINIVVNKFKTITVKSNLYKLIENKEIAQLEKIFQTQKCIKEPSLYSIMETKSIDGWEFKVLKKNTKIYKTISGFIDEEQNNKFKKSKPLYKPFWFGNKYVVYGYSRLSYSPIYSYTIKNDIYLLDFLNKNNIDKIHKLLYKKHNKLLDQLNIMIGYKLNLINHIKKIINYTRWNEIWLYTKKSIILPTYNCNINKNKDFKHPMTTSSYMNVIDSLIKLLFNYFNINNIKFSGFVIDPIFSNLDHNGIFKQEEFIITNKSIITNIKRDKSNNLDWTNWKFKHFKINNENFILSDDYFTISSYSDKINSNTNFSLTKFYFNNKTKFPIIKGNNYILSYNIHFFNNINKLIEIKDNYNNIIKLIKKYNKNINNLIFQEVRFDDINKKMVFDTLNKLGFNTIKYTENGTKNNKMNILLASKNKLDIKIVNHKDSKNTYRNSILFTDSDFTGCAVHLTIGDRYYVDVSDIKDDNLKIKNHNYKERTNQLRGIIKHKPDFIIGDFNFTPEDDETDFLLKNGYNMVTPKTGNTTPYNRVDMCFLHKDSIVKFKNYKNIQCNYSDHLPFMLQIE